MYFIPAIDIKNEACVRLYKGKFEKYKIYGNDPLEVVQKYKLDQADWLHIVDLDGAVVGDSQNMYIIKEIIKSVSCRIQVGGGIRHFSTIEKYLSMGVNRVILGTSVLEDFDFVRQASNLYYGRLIISIDTVNGYIATDGWTKTTGIRYNQVLDKLLNLGIAAIIWTDINRDGTLIGINTVGLCDFIKASRIPVMVSGGLSGIRDLIELYNAFKYKLAAVIAGKAIYERFITVKMGREILQF